MNTKIKIMCIYHPTRSVVHLSRHHLTAKSRGGVANKQNILYLWSDRHHFWHCLFQNATLDEIINDFGRKCLYDYMSPQWKAVFGNKSVVEAIHLLARVRRIKKSLVKKPYWQRMKLDSPLSTFNH